MNDSIHPSIYSHILNSSYMPRTVGAEDTVSIDIFVLRDLSDLAGERWKAESNKHSSVVTVKCLNC